MLSRCLFSQGYHALQGMSTPYRKSRKTQTLRGSFTKRKQCCKQKAMWPQLNLSDKHECVISRRASMVSGMLS
jgi:hypothetical protein